MRFLALSVGVLALAAGHSPSQWGSRGCPPVGGFAAPVFASPYAAAPTPLRSWGTHPADPGRWQLYAGGRHIGSYCALEGIYRDYDGSRWSEPRTPPTDVPAEAVAATKVRWQSKQEEKPAKNNTKPGCGCAAKCRCAECCCECDGPCVKGCDCFAAAALGCTCPAGKCHCTWEKDCGHQCFCAAKVENAGPNDPVRNFGLDLRGMREDTTEHYHINGRYVARDQVYEALMTGTLTDDRSKRRLSIIGSDADCKRALGTLPADLSAKYLVQCLKPDNFLVARTGFKTDGAPTIYLQQPPDPKTGFGEVLWREDTLTAQTWDNFRKADPDYKPDADPNPNKPKPAPAVPATPAPAVTGGIPWYVWAGGALALLFCLQDRTKPPQR